MNREGGAHRTGLLNEYTSEYISTSVTWRTVSTAAAALSLSHTQNAGNYGKFTLLHTLTRVHYHLEHIQSQHAKLLSSLVQTGVVGEVKLFVGGAI